MSITNLQATTAYKQVQSQIQANNAQIKDTNDFQEMMRANMAQVQTLAQAKSINRVFDSVYIEQIASAEPSIIGTLRKKLRKQEEVSLKSMVGEASPLDLLHASTDAKNILEIMVKLRTEVQQAWDKLLNMSI